MFLLDMNVFSDAHKGVPEPSNWLDAVDPLTVYVSVVTICEIERGIEMIRGTNLPKAHRLETWLAGLRYDCSDRILPVTEDVAIRWGRLMAGRSRGDADLSLLRQPSFIN